MSDKPGAVDRVHSIDAVISELLRAVTFLGFVIVYYNILSAVGIFQRVGDLHVAVPYFDGVDIGGWLKRPLYVALYTPIAFTAFVVILFARNFVVELIGLLREVEFGIWSIFLFFGAIVGTISFVGVLSLFVAFQSDDYLTRFAPTLQAQLDSLLGVERPAPPSPFLPDSECTVDDPTWPLCRPVAVPTVACIAGVTAPTCPPAPSPGDN